MARISPAYSILCLIQALGTILVARADSRDKEEGDGDRVDSFKPIASFNVPGGGNAEIVAATPDGRRLVYVNSLLRKVGVVDITHPAHPVQTVEVPVEGEPTCAAVTPDGKFALVTVQTLTKVPGAPPVVTPGELVFLHLATGTLTGKVALGTGPDAVAVTVIDRRTVAVIAVENEPIVVDANGNFVADDAPGNPNDTSEKGLVQVVIVDWEDIPHSRVIDIRFDDASQFTALGLPFPNDPQPENVAIRGRKAAVTLQENDAVAIIDLSRPARPVLESLFSLGSVADRPADLKRDGVISFSQKFPADVPATAPTKALAGTRMPDGIAWSSDGSTFYTADEGEVNFAGGRGFSAWQPDGAFLFDDGGEIEEKVVSVGQYPEPRSNVRGVEMEGIDTGVFGQKEFAFIGSERGGFLAVYDISEPALPRFVQILPSGLRPEGVLAIGARNLVVTANEGDGGPGTISIFKGISGPFVPDATRPQLRSSGLDNPFGAISGLAPDLSRARVIYAVPDNALVSSVFRIEVKGPAAEISVLFPVTLNGVQAKYDLEGIAVDTSIEAPANRGFWLASEGNAQFGAPTYAPNLLVEIDGTGAVLQEIRLPPAIDPPGAIVPPDTTDGKIGSNGFEGVTLSSNGRFLLGCIQREFSKEPAVGGRLHARIARFDLMNDAWEFFLYPLETTAVPGDFMSLSEIINLGRDRYAVIERDKGVGSLAKIKRVYAFTLEGVAPFSGVVTAGADLSGQVIEKTLLFDVLQDFAPYEKVEGLAFTRERKLWVALDNDGGAVESRFINVGRLPSQPESPDGIAREMAREE